MNQRHHKTGGRGRPWVELEKPKPPRVADEFTFTSSPPPVLSEACLYWARQISRGWMPNSRILRNGGADWYGVWCWEYRNILEPMIRAHLAHGGPPGEPAPVDDTPRPPYAAPLHAFGRGDRVGWVDESGAQFVGYVADIVPGRHGGQSLTLTDTPLDPKPFVEPLGRLSKYLNRYMTTQFGALDLMNATPLRDHWQAVVTDAMGRIEGTQGETSPRPGNVGPDNI